jgi:hypothetical protein
VGQLLHHEWNVGRDAAGLRVPDAEQGIDTFLTPTFAHFGGVLIQAMVMLVPWPSPLPISIILLLFGVVALGWQIACCLKFADWRSFR